MLHFPERRLLVMADDFGIGPATSRGILELGMRGRVTAMVMLVNSPHAEAGIREWRRAGQPMELGWHPCLTTDGPILPPSRVPSLVNSEGRFHALGRLLYKLLRRQISFQEVKAEWTAQLLRFVELTGFEPSIVNSHQHVGIFPMLGGILRRVLRCLRRRPFVRRVREPWSTRWKIPGALLKRLFLDQLGRREARRLSEEGYPGCEWLAGLANPASVKDPRFFERWLQVIPGRSVELMCHPGHFDETLIGRDGTLENGAIHRRPTEFELLAAPSFSEAVIHAGFRLCTPAEFASDGQPALSAKFAQCA